MKEKLARWYRQGLWTAAMVQEAVDKGLITQEDCVEIVGTEKA
uniref:XkdX family protein n=1 Tax=Siphoviridae sp. ctvok7 TaxID=2827596 RepID=A0A8S5LL86_9CAUD|nr:MAG TPA: hypothetical protein [Siphoviridae sp. ctvok7]